MLTSLYASLGVAVGAGILFLPRSNSRNSSALGIVTAAYISIAFIFRGYMSAYIMAACAIVALSVFCKAVQYKAALIAAWVSVAALAWSVSSVLLFTGHLTERDAVGTAVVPPAVAWLIAVVVFIIQDRVKRSAAQRN